MVSLAVGAVIGVASLVTGIVKANQAAQAAQEQATKSAEQNVLLAQQQGFNELVVGQGHDISAVISAVTNSKIQATATTKIESLKQQGNTLMIVGGGIIVLSLAIMVFKKRT